MILKNYFRILTKYFKILGNTEKILHDVEKCFKILTGAINGGNVCS